ncbi:hypothetical protein D3C86_2157250 [compost metagenome]
MEKVAHQKPQAEIAINHRVCATLEIDQAQLAIGGDQDVLWVRVHVHEAFVEHAREQIKDLWQQG